MSNIKRFSVSIKSVSSDEVDIVLGVLLRSFNVCSVCIQKSKRGGGV